MIKLNFQSKKYNKIYFSSDFHLHHKRPFIHEARGFSKWEDHSAFVEKSLLELTDDDLLFFLGDFALNADVEKVEAILASIKCETYMCWGNHNSIIKHAYKQAKLEFFGGEKDVDVYPLKIAENVTLMGDDFIVSIDGKTFYCNHFAPLVWDHQQHGRPCCHGHSHSNLYGSQPNEHDLGKILDVGVDNALKYNGTPFFSFQEVCEIIDSKPIKTFDHHGE